MLNPETLTALFSSSVAMSAYSFLGNYFAEKSLDHLLSSKPDLLTAHEIISRQLYEALTEALRLLCDEFHWEFDECAISDTFSEGNNMWAGISSAEKLITVLRNAIGDDHSRLVTEEVAEFWIDAFSREIACRQQLFNYLHSKESRELHYNSGNVIDNRIDGANTNQYRG